MKKLFKTVMTVSVVIGLLGFFSPNAIGPNNCIAGDLGPALTMGTPMVKMSKNTKVVIMGSGFKPGQELRVIIITQDGVETDIWSRMKPAPTADATGTWASTWNAGRYVSRKLMKEGVYKITATDDDYNPIASAPVFFQKPKKSKDKKK